MTDLKQLLTDYPDFRCTAGRCIIRMERKPAMHNSLHIPDIARDIDPNKRDMAYFGTVVRVTPRRDTAEEFAEGDRVWVMLLMSDLGKEFILTENVRVYALETHRLGH